MSQANLNFENRQQQSGTTGNTRSGKDVYSLDLVDLALRKFWLILFFVLVGIGLSVLYYLKAPKTYESTAKIFVDEKNAPTMQGGNRDSFVKDDSVEKYLEMLKSTTILEPAINVGKLYDMEMFSKTEDILFELREEDGFKVMPADAKSSSGVIKLTFKSKEQEECRKVLASIVNSFDGYIKSTTRNIGGENADFVQRAETKWLGRLKDVEQEIEQLVGSPELLTVDGKVVNPHQVDLSMMRTDLHALRSERMKTIARLSKVKRDLAVGKVSDDMIAEIMREEAGVSDNAYARVNQQLVELRIEEQDLLNQYGDDHPQLRAVQRKITTVEQMLQTELAAMRGGRAADVDSTLVQQFIEQMERKNALLVAEETQMDSEVRKIQIKSTTVAALVERLNALNRERERLEKGYYALVEKMSEMNALKEHLWRNLSVLDPPSIAEEVAPKLSKCLIAGLFLGSLAGIGFAVFKDAAEKTFRSSDAVGELLDTRVIGHVSLFDRLRPNKLSKEYPGIQPAVIALHAPAAQASEAYRAIRTSLFFNAREKNAKVIQITSPAPADGKSTTVANLATSMAQSGQRVLLIDADMRKPTQHRIFGVSNEVGLSSIIGGEVSLAEAVQPVIPEYLSVISSGPIPSNPAELLTSGHFASTIAELREEYDYVLIDTPPMLAVADPSIVCSHAELIYMVMRIRKGVRSNSARAKEIMESMGVELDGVIINGLRRRDHQSYNYSGQYGYGSYAYGKSAKVASL